MEKYNQVDEDVFKMKAILQINKNEDKADTKL